MSDRFLRGVIVVCLAFLVTVGAVGEGRRKAKAETQPAFDRHLTERLVRAEERQAKALEALANELRGRRCP